MEQRSFLTTFSTGDRVRIDGFHSCYFVKERHKLLVLGLTKGVIFIIKRVMGAGELFEIELRNEKFILRKQALSIIICSKVVC